MNAGKTASRTSLGGEEPLFVGLASPLQRNSPGPLAPLRSEPQSQFLLFGTFWNFFLSNSFDLPLFESANGDAESRMYLTSAQCCSKCLTHTLPNSPDFPGDVHTRLTAEKMEVQGGC